MSSSTSSTLEKKSSFNIFDFWKTNEDEDDDGDTTGGAISKLLNEATTDDGGEGGDENAWEDIPQQQDEETNKGVGGWMNFVDTFKKVTNVAKGGDDTDTEESALQGLIEKARGFHSSSDATEDVVTSSLNKENVEKLWDEVKIVIQQVSESFGQDIDVKLLNPVSFNYYLEQEESRKTPSWKRRKHRFLQELKLETVYALHDALYLAEASYLDSVDDIVMALKEYKGPPYELVYCRTDAKPRQPAHFIAIKKSRPPKSSSDSKFPWKKDKDKNTTTNVLEVLMVVRGTKEIPDMLSDCLVDTREYCGGYAHDGVCQSGMYLVEQHAEFLQKMLKESGGRSTIRLSLIGHSLGAGAASIACMEFNTDDRFSDWLDVSCIGFGCPALVSKELSEQHKSKITTIISDADCVPRMSGATVKNLVLNVSSYDWTDHGLRDVEELMQVVKMCVPFELPEQLRNDALTWARSYVEKEVKPDIAKTTKERATVQLFPPGTCIHMYRDGHGVTATYVPCDFFDELDVCRTMVDDHLIPTGYDRLFHEWARQQLDSRFFFKNDVKLLRAETHRRREEQDAAEKK